MSASKPQFVYLTMLVKAFSCETARNYRFCVDSDGDVTVWDSSSEIWTRCHSLGDADIETIREKAKDPAVIHASRMYE